MATKKLLVQRQMEESLQVIFADVFQQVSRRRSRPEVVVTFYPFVGLNHTIRLRNQRLYVRVSDILHDAPLAVYRALAHILVGKLLNRRPPVEEEAIYQEYAYQPRIMRASDLARQQRGRKQLNGAAGRVYDLEQIFVRLNRNYFHNTLPQPVLTWSARRTKRILGHHDALHNTIVISRSLDMKSVPEYVVEYVMYHEMLHIKHPARIVNGRRIFHPSAFRAEEKQYARYQEALKWLEQGTRRGR
ncbi:MAG TPA: SprT-like domain-containing protein [Blastocatellia bacterium]|nr:SprT-like domain-containing protein [Blastocatellia bacterium]